MSIATAPLTAHSPERLPRVAEINVQADFNPVKLAALEIVAHDLRGPLSNLVLLIEGIREANDVGDKDRIAGQTVRAGRTLERMTEMLHAMLDRARYFHDDRSRKLENIELVDLIETVAFLNRPLAGKRSVHLHTRTFSPSRLRGDSDLLLQAVDNLVTNAIRHSPEGGVVLLEGCVQDDQVVIRVSDQGKGLEAATRSQLFKPGRTLGTDQGRVPHSYGLGLWIVSLIAEQHHGTAEAANNSCGRGALFTVRLPLDQE